MKKLIKQLNLNLADKADTIKRLFCAAILTEGVDVSARVLGHYNAWESDLKLVEAELPASPTKKPSDLFCKLELCENSIEINGKLYESAFCVGCFRSKTTIGDRFKMKKQKQISFFF